MKTITILFAVILSFNISAIFAGNPVINLNPKSSFVLVDYSDLAPVIPAEADFSDYIPVDSFDLQNLVPVNPSEADFSDSPEDISDIPLFNSMLPQVADFD